MPERIQDERRTRSLSIVVPVYRSEATLPALHRRLTAALDDLVQEYEVILVDDGSDDGSWQAIRNLAMGDPRVRGVRLGRNAGQHNALLCGIRMARYPVTVTMDDDLQNPPEEISVLLAALDEGHDVVYGAPLREQHGLLRDLASRLTKIALQDVMGSENARHVSAFRVFRTRLRDAFADYTNPFVSIDVLLTYGTDRFGHVQVRHDARAAGRSSYTLRKLVVHAMNMMTGFTTIPLQMASLAGFFCALLGVLILVYVLATWLAQGSVVPGFAFLASIVAIFSGVQLFALGIVGEYLGRVHVSTTARPPYLVRDRAGDDGVGVGSTELDPTPAEREVVSSGLGGS